MARNLIHIQWHGPFSLAELSQFSDQAKDRGVYQIYGSHPVYGVDALLYIGKVREQTFAKRIKRPGWEYWDYDEGKVSVRLGRLAGEQTPSDAQWKTMIDLAEAILINAHKPAHNASMVAALSDENDERLANMHVLNWGDYGALLPEVSGDRWTEKWASDDYDVFGSHG